MRQNDPHRAGIFKVIKPVQQKRVIRLTCRRQFPKLCKAGIGKKTLFGVVLLRVRRIHHHRVEIRRFIRGPIGVQRIAVSQMLMRTRHPVQHHVHARQVEGLVFKFLSKEMHGRFVVDVLLFVVSDAVPDLQQKGARPTRGVVNREPVFLILPQRHDAGN